MAMGRVRAIPGGYVVYPALRVSEGPPEVWAAIAADQRRGVQVAMGRGPSARAAEMAALAKLGTPTQVVRAALESADADENADRSR